MADKTDFTPDPHSQPGRRSGGGGTPGPRGARPHPGPHRGGGCGRGPEGQGRAGHPARREQAHRGGAEDGGRLCQADRPDRLQRGAPVRRGGPEEHRRLFREHPQLRAHQGSGGDRPGPVLPGGGAEGLRQGGGREGHLRLFQKEEKRAGGHEGGLHQGGGQRGQDRRGWRAIR